MINKKISFDLRLFIFPRKKEDWNFTKHRLINRRSNFNHQTGIRNTLTRIVGSMCISKSVWKWMFDLLLGQLICRNEEEATN